MADKEKAALVAKIRAMCPGRFGEGLKNRPVENLRAMLEELEATRVVFEGGPLHGRIEYQYPWVVEREILGSDGSRYRYVREGARFIPGN